MKKEKYMLSSVKFMLNINIRNQVFPILKHQKSVMQQNAYHLSCIAHTKSTSILLIVSKQIILKTCAGFG